MKSSLYTYSFLGLMVIALVSLAVLQYQWLGSVSDAEKERLEENLSAASENFVADFDEVFTNLGAVFRVQVSSPEDDIRPTLNTALQTWIRNSTYPEVVDSIFVINTSNSEKPEVFLFSSDPVLLNPVQPSDAVKSWIIKNGKNVSQKKVSLKVQPDFGENSFLSVPVQFLDMIQVSNQKFGQKVEVQLSVDQLDDVVLLKLDNRVIKEKVIPDIARTYYSDSYDDQYTLSLVKDDEEPYVYFTSGNSNDIPEPDFRSSLDRFSLNSVLVFQSNPFSVGNKSLPGLADSIRGGFGEIDFFKEGSFDTSFGDIHGIRTDFQSQTISRIKTRDSSSWQVQTRDTTITSNLTASLASSSWELWLSFKEGSLDAFVNKTRNRNLAISFGILSILGISVVLIVVFSQRSRELAEQQMLFVAGVSHELRTPITVIRSAAENLTEGVVQTEERKKQYASLMLREGRRLSDMVDQIMEFSGIQTGKRVYHFTQVNLGGLFDSVKEESRHLLEEKGMHLEYSINTKQKSIYADPDALFLCISNLINNAIKFSGNSKKVLLKVDDESYRGKSALKIQVQDFGMGIPEKEQAFVFKPFFRGAKPVSDQVKGNGIGLSLVRKVVDAHLGEITLKSKEEQGSTFSVILPVEGVDVG
ncbi:MAG: sensor histidine kinase [Balneola sp.]